MPRALNLSGQRFGSLLVVSKSNASDQLGVYWNCLCVCGQSIAVVAAQLRARTKTSCGCVARRREEQRQRNRQEAIDKWTLVGQTWMENGRQVGRYVCHCGATTKKYAATKVKSGTARGCPFCFKRHTHRKFPNELQGINALYGQYRRRHSSRFDSEMLSLDLFSAKIKLPCHYCGTPPTAQYGSSGCSARAKVTYNGLDRVDPNRGYEEGNVVPCCKVCNTAKMDLAQEAFFSWVTKIANHLSETGRLRISCRPAPVDTNR